MEWLKVAAVFALLIHEQFIVWPLESATCIMIAIPIDALLCLWTAVHAIRSRSFSLPCRLCLALALALACVFSSCTLWPQLLFWAEADKGLHAAAVLLQYVAFFHECRYVLHGYIAQIVLLPEGLYGVR